MMKKLQNDKGYTLILTLVIIIIIVIFFSSFTLSAMNQQKQVEKTDETYEVTAVAEMGVEYYKAKILNEMKTAEIATQAVINNSTLQNAQRTTQINTIFTDLKASLRSYSTDNLSTLEIFENSTRVDSSNNISFYLDGKNPPSFSFNDSIFTIEVIGRVEDKTKSIIAKFAFPASIASLPTTGGGSPSGSSYNNLINLPIFPSTSKPSNVSICPTVDSVTGSIDTQYICYSSTLDKLEKILNLNLYYTGPIELQNLNDNFKGLNKFYANTSITLNNLKPKDNSKHYINGDATIGSIDNTKNTTIYSKGNMVINSINSLNYLNLYSDNKITFKNAIGGNNLSLIASEVSFNNLNNTNSYFNVQVSGNATFAEINTINNSNFTINGQAIFNTQNTGTIKGNSILLLDSIKFSSKNNNILKIEDTSKVCIRNVNYEDIKHSINTTADSKLVILVKNSNEVKITRHVHLVMETQFNQLCNSSSGTNFVTGTLPTDENIISEVIYR